MHPMISRFFDLSAAKTAILAFDRKQSIDRPSTLYAEAALSFGDARRSIASAQVRPHLSAELEQQLIIVSAKAASLALADDAKLGPKAMAARAAFEAEGATPEQAEHFVIDALLDEAFGYAEDPSTFDVEFFSESLDSLVPLARLTPETIDTWTEEFVKRCDIGNQALRLEALEVLIATVWSEGPQLLSPEQIDVAVGVLSETLAHEDLKLATLIIERFLNDLAEKQVIGPIRASRLQLILKTAVASELSQGDDEDPDEEEAADEEAKDE